MTRESELARLAPRARKAVAPVVGLLLLTWTGFYFAAQFELALQRWIIAIGTGVLVLLLCAPALARWAGIRYRITPQRLHARRGLVRVRRAVVDFDPRMSVSVSRTPAQRLARCADVHHVQDGEDVIVLREAIAAAPMPVPEWPDPLPPE